MIAEKLSVLKKAETMYIRDASLRLIAARSGCESVLLGKYIFFLHVSLAFNRSELLMNCC